MNVTTVLPSADGITQKKDGIEKEALVLDFLKDEGINLIPRNPMKKPYEHIRVVLGCEGERADAWGGIFLVSFDLKNKSFGSIDPFTTKLGDIAPVLASEETILSSVNALTKHSEYKNISFDKLKNGDFIAKAHELFKILSEGPDFKKFWNLPVIESV